jgi:hypothetical protein
MTHLLAFAIAMDGRSLVLLFGFLMGVVLFIFGFRTYREYRLLADTPVAPVRSIPMGLVHVRGKATGEAPLTSALTGAPCYYYKVDVEKWVKKDKSEGWEHVSSTLEERTFHLDDGTGKVLVNPHDAEYDVPCTFRAEVAPPAIIHIGRQIRFVDPSLGVPGPSDEELRAYLAGNFTKARNSLASVDVPGAKMLGSVLAAEQKLSAMGLSLSAGGVEIGFANHRYRFTENCLLAERDCNILGTCAENQNPKDEHDRNMLMKGQNEKTFLITTKAEGEIEKSLRWKAFALIFFGAVIMIGVAAIALHGAGML